MNRTTRILLADDDPAILELLGRVLRLGGYEVSQAATGRQALLEARRQRPDLALLDVILPDMNGLEICRQIKADPALVDTFVVLMSGEAIRAEHKVAGLESGADDYLSKPMDMEELLARVGTMARLQRATAALRLSDQHHRRLVEILPDAMFVIDPAGQLSAVNSQAVALLGYRQPAELLSKTIFDLTPPQHHDRIRADIAATLHSGALRSAESALVTGGGRSFSVELSSAVLEAANDQAPRVVLLARDITERKRAQVELEKLALVVQHSSELVYLAGLDGRLIFINRAGSRMVGILPEDVQRHGIYDLVAPGSQQAARDEVVPTTLEQGRWEGELQYRNLKTGRLTDVHAMVFLVREPATGKPLYLANVSLDLTERRRAEEQIRLLADAVQSTHELVSITSSENYFTFFNQAFLNAYGYSQAELLGRKPEFLYSPANLPGLGEQIFHETLTGGWRGELLTCRKDGSEFPISLSTSQIKSAEGKTLGLLSMARDISERKRAERQRTAFAQLGYRLSSAVEPGQAAGIVLDIASELLGWEAGYVHLYSQAEDKIIPVMTVDTIGGQRVNLPSADVDAVPSPAMRLVMARGAQLLNHGPEEPSLAKSLVPFGDTNRRSASMMYAPIRSGGSAVGILSIQSYRPQTYTTEDLNLLQGLADYCGDALHRINVTKALLDAEAKYRQIVENATEGIFQTTPEGRYRSANSAMARILGYPDVASLLEGITDVARQVYVQPERRQEFKRLLESQDAVRDFEVDFFRRDGSTVWVIQNAHAVRDAGGELLYYEGTVLDITERKQAEDLLQVQRDFGLFLNSTNDLLAAAERLAEIARQTPGIDCAAVYLVEAETGALRLAADRGLASRFRGRGSRFAEDSAAARLVAQDRADDWLRGEPLASLVPAHRRERVVALETIPLRHGGRVVALLCIGSQTAQHVPARSRLRLETVAGQAGDALARIQAQEQLRHLPRRITAAQEAERQRVARELHDGVNQIIAAAKLRLRKVQENVHSVKPAAREMLARCADLLVRALEENRRIAHGLRPSELDELGLAEACRNFCQQVRLRTRLALKCTITGLTQRLAPGVELNLFRIVQEAISNVEKHASASNVEVRLAQRGGTIALRIRDDGHGFEPKAAKTGRKQGHGIGLTNLHDRAASIGGVCEIKSVPGRGTEVIVRVPCKPPSPG